MASIKRSVLSDQVKDVLLKAILTGHYPPGSRIVETRVARDLGVSQAPVREALRDLEALGVVEATAFKGSRVRRPDRAELAEAYGIRAELESLAARLALPHLGDTDVADLQTLLDEAMAAATAGDRQAQVRLDTSFHGRIVDASANATLRRVWRFLEPVSRTWITLVAHAMDADELANLHQPIIDGLARHDTDAATAAIRRHFQLAAEMFAALPDDDVLARSEEGGPALPVLASLPNRLGVLRRSIVAPVATRRHPSREHG